MIFVSHRWNGAEYPDDDGQQLRILQQFCSSIVNVANAMSMSKENRLSNVPTLWNHGILQAAAVVSAGLNSSDLYSSIWDKWKDLCRDAQGTLNLGNVLLEHIGFWYDFCCVPQLNEPDNTDALQSSLFQEALLDIPQLVASCAVVSIRYPFDEYSNRGWCAAEMSIGNGREKHLTLRPDLFGSKINRADILLDNPDPNEEPAINEIEHPRSTLAKALDDWEASSNAENAVFEIYPNYWDLRQGEDDREIPLFTSPRPPKTFPGHRELLVYEISVTSRISSMDQESGGTEGIDLEEFCTHAMQTAGLKCSKLFDLIFVCLTMLEVRRSDSETQSEFYRNARTRWLRGQSLRLQRFRNDLEPYKEKVWYLFDDESIDDRPIPDWVSGRRSGFLANAMKKIKGMITKP